MKILVLVPFHERPEISEIFWLGIHRLRQNFNISTFAIVSDEDNLKLSKVNSDYFLSTSNEPLGRKMNHGLSEAMKLDFDYLMQLGSDDLITNNILFEYEKVMQSQNPFFGLNKSIIFNCKTSKYKKLDCDHIHGGGRCIRKDIIEKYKYYNVLGMSLWDDNKYSGLDSDSRNNIHEKETIIDLGDYEIIDIKSQTNIWKYELFGGPEESIESLKSKISTLEYNNLIRCAL